MDKGDRKLHVSKAHKEEKSFLNRRNELFRRLPKIDRIMGMELTKELTEQYGYRAVLEAARKVEEQLRDAMRQQILAEEKPAVFLDTSGLSGQKDGLPVKLSDLKALSGITLDYTGNEESACAQEPEADAAGDQCYRCDSPHKSGKSASGGQTCVGTCTFDDRIYQSGIESGRWEEGKQI